MYTEDKQALRHRKSVLSIPPPNDTKRHLINCALTPAHKHRRACRETSTHRHKHIFQPTPAWTHSCAAGLSFSVCDVFAHCFTGGHQRRSSPLLKGGRGGGQGWLWITTFLVVCHYWLGFPKAEGKWIIAFYLSATTRGVWKKQLHPIQLPTHRDSLNMRNTLHTNDN